MNTTADESDEFLGNRSKDRTAKVWDSGLIPVTRELVEVLYWNPEPLPEAECYRSTRVEGWMLHSVEAVVES